MAKRQAPPPRPRAKEKPSEDPIKGLKNALKASQIAGLARALAEQGFRGGQ